MSMKAKYPSTKQKSHIFFDEEETEEDRSSAPSEEETQERSQPQSKRIRKPSIKKKAQLDSNNKPQKVSKQKASPKGQSNGSQSQAEKSSSLTTEDMTDWLSDSRSAADDEDDDTLLYSSQTFVTCRSPSDSFYLCQLLEDVHEDTKKIRIRWCSLVDGEDDDTPIGIKTRFQLSYVDTLDPRAILLGIDEVLHETPTVFTLRKKDLVETKRLLTRSIRSKSISSDDMMDLSTEVSSKKKSRKHTRHIHFTSGSDEESAASASQSDLGVTPGPRKRKITAKKQKKQPANKRQRKAANPVVRGTVENLAVELYRREPFFEDTFPVPFISSLVQSKLAIRAVLKNDAKLLNSLINDVHRVCSVHVRRSTQIKLTPIHYAIKTNRIPILKLLLKDLQSPKEDRCPFPTISMATQSTGRASIRTLGFRTARLMASRGAKEGNNALNQDDLNSLTTAHGGEIVQYAIENNCSPEVYDLLFQTFPESHEAIYANLNKVIRAGHRRLAAKIIGDIKDNVFHGFNYLHHQVLLNDEEDITINRSVSVMKKTRANDQITPIHCAAINPNVKYLKQLLHLMPEFNVLDRYERRPIHFAAACEGSAPLEYLLSKHMNFNDVDRGGNAPLHIAAMTGRATNVEVLLRKAKENVQPENMDDDENDEPPVNEKFGPASIHRLNKSFYSPLHLAVLNDHLDCVHVLLEFEADPNAVTSKTAKLTPLMLACQKGHTHVASYLLNHGAKLEARDRFKRTPLIHACMCGNSDIVAYLLRKGADPNASDSSLNTPLHYAMAYGWYFSVRSLLEAGANLHYANSWQTTCLATGFLKGHYGLCDYLLTDHGADINFQTEDGLTLVMLTVGLQISTSVVQQLDYVLNKHHADCTTVDANGSNAFHYLASNESAKLHPYIDKETKKTLQQNLLKLAELLLHHHCNPNQLNAKAQSPLMIALENGNSLLIDVLIKQVEVSITGDVSDDGKTVLHYFAMNCDQYELTEAFTQLPVNDEMKVMGQVFDQSGRTALHYCVSKFDEFCQRNGSSQSTEELKKQYQSIVRMIEYCLESMGCDPDATIKSNEKSDEVAEEKIEDSDEDDDDEMSDASAAVATKKSSSGAGQASIFFLLRNVPFIDATTTHPLEYLLHKTKNLNILHHKSQRTPLLEAIHLQQSHTAELLISDPSCNLNLASSTMADDHHGTPLMVACRGQLLSVVRCLLAAKHCDLFAFDDKHNQALHYYLQQSVRTKEYLNVLDQFLQRIQTTKSNAFSEQGEHQRTPLHIAVYHNQGTIDANTEAEKRLIQFGGDLMVADDQGNLPLHNVFLGVSTTNDRVELCALLIKAMKYQALDTKNKEGNTPLHLAVAQGATVCVMILQKHGASLSVDNHLSNSIIGTCIVSNHLNLFITFLQQSIDIDLSKLHRIPAKELGDQTVWRWKPSVAKNPPEYTEYPLIYSIIELDWQGALSMILEDIDRYHLTNLQILEAAIFHKKLNLFLRLLSHITDEKLLKKKNVKGQNLLHLLANIGQCDEHLLREILLHLHENHLDWNTPDKSGSYPLHYACVKNNFVFIDFLRENYSTQLNLNQKDGAGNTPVALLFWSLAHRTTFPSEQLRQLITSGDQLDCLCHYENQSITDPLSFGYLHPQEEEKPYPLKEPVVRTSPLIHAIVHQNFPLVKFLLELDADLNYPDGQKRTPMMHAVRQNNIHLVKLLLNTSYSPDANLLAQQSKRSKKNAKSFFLGAAHSNGDDDDDDDDEENEDNDDDNEKVTGEHPSTQPFEQTSSIDLDAADGTGFTCTHHLVQPFPDGSFVNNLELLRLLHSCGATLDPIDALGLTPLQYSLKNKCPHLSNELITLMKQPIPTKKVKLARFAVDDPHQDLFGQADFYHDAEEVIEQYNASHPPTKYNPAYAINHWSGMTQTGEVILDPDTQQPYDVRLTKIDVTYGTYGLYNFYRMQMIKHKSKKNLFFLFTHWGFIGAGEGQHQLTPFSTLEECRKEFLKVFRAKTANLWANLNQFEAKPKKYSLVPTEERQMEKLPKVPIDFDRLHVSSDQLPSKLQSSSYKNLMRTLLSREAIRGPMQQIALDVDWMPVSQLSREQLEQARDLLRKIKETIEKKDKLAVDHLQAKTIEHKDQVKELLQEIYRYTNEYYTLVPLNGYADEKLPIIGDDNTLKAQEKLIDDLFELELSYKMLLAAQANLKRCSPLDYLYRSMRCQFEAMDLTDMDSQLILRYVWASAPEVKVEQIFKLERENENERLEKSQIENHCLLWHGTNICNLISILTRGLLVGTITAATTGSLFGKGIYTADTFMKSLGYCSGVKDDKGERCFMLLCEVALGNVKEITPQDNDDGQPLDLKTFHSRKGLGRQNPDPKDTITRNYGTQMPLGPIIDSEILQNRYCYLPYNEYIVYDEAQVALRYLVQFRR